MRAFLPVARLVALSILTSGVIRLPSTLPVVQANDNRHSAGVRHGDTLVVRLTAQMARWYPEDSGGAFADVLTLGEEGKAPQIPAPLLRAPVGTLLDVTITNTLTDSSLWLHGMATHPTSFDDSVQVAPGQSLRRVFIVGAAGTYTYLAWPGNVDRQTAERETAGGAFVVDTVGAPADDRVFVMNIWSQSDSTSGNNALSINGKSWPFTEHIPAVVGDTLRWRVVNVSMRPHPMHLHGFFFQIDAEGDGFRDSTFAKRERRSVVTEVMGPGATMAMRWVPERAGNWLFHCHISFHVTPDARLSLSPETHDAQAHDMRMHMAGLILGINVAPKPGEVAESRTGARQLRLFVQEGKRRAHAKRALGYVLQDGREPPARDSIVAPGSLLVLTVGQPTDITVVNRLGESTAIHWHGIELESYSDGVAGWSGSGARLAPMIAPNDSFVARLTMPRAGTFMYHTHLNDMEQLSSGLYGPIVVLPRGQRFDPATDHTFIVGWDGPADPPHLLVNGDSTGHALQLKAGAMHRFRFMNIGAAIDFTPAIKQDTAAVPWQLTAQDGAELPSPRMIPAGHTLGIDVGQTADFTWRAPATGRYVLTIRGGADSEFKFPIVIVR